MDLEKLLQSISNQEGLLGARLITRLSKLARSPESIAVEDLTKAFKKLSINLV